jgi:hypothetical protein
MILSANISEPPITTIRVPTLGALTPLMTPCSTATTSGKLPTACPSVARSLVPASILTSGASGLCGAFCNLKTGLGEITRNGSFSEISGLVIGCGTSFAVSKSFVPFNKRFLSISATGAWLMPTPHLARSCSRLESNRLPSIRASSRPPCER